MLAIAPKPTTISDYFEKNRHVYLEGALSKEECANLTKRLFSLKEQGLLTKDSQCPLSWSVYGDPELDAILARLAEPLSQQLGITLLPTYTYARIYQPGEVLKRHIDRESCEISGTLTLGHDPESEIWPIFFSRDPQDIAGQSISIEVGDLVMYRGNELTHWRPAYIGRWQTQVFFHFVDANGPHKNWANDKRPALGTKERKIEKPVVQVPKVEAEVNKIYNGVMIPSNQDNECPGAATYNSKFRPELAFTKDECKRIVSLAQNKYPEKSRVGTSETQKFAPEVRRVEQYTLDLNNETKWIFDKIATAVGIANKEYYNFEIMGITHGLQLLHYKADEQGFYDWHTDVGPGNASTRKISASIMLSEETDYVGGDLIINNFGNEITASKEIGAINMFPSYLLHTVTPVTKGDRWVLVIWVHGSQRFK